MDRLDLFTIISTLVVICIYAGFAIYVKNQKKQEQLEAKRRWIEQLPSLVSTIGVLGTFIGITKGLIGFDTNDISGSIPTLLGGLSTAFFTSLAGMIGSLLLSRQVNGYYDEIEKGVSDATSAATMVVTAIQSLLQEYKTQGNIQTSFQNYVTTKIDSLTSTISNLHDNQVSKSQITFLQNSIDKSQKLLQDSLNTQSSIITNINDIHTNIENICTNSSKTVDYVREISNKVTTLTENIHNEVQGIDSAMNRTNKLLEMKFDEFSELLKKSNTEALVEVMKKVTEEFQKQMGELINKLVQENFEQLNKSVEQLNTWQTENKEMIISLTNQYREMSNNFNATSTTLSKVGNDTKLLVSEGGKLEQIVNALNQVLIEDTKFIEISSKLADSATLTKENMEMFDESTKTLNEWVKKQRNFVEGVTLLINKLDEINKINDYSEVFWANTKKGLNEAVGTIRGTIESLNKEIEELNGHFYARLSATLSELDTCMQAIVKGRR